MTNPQNQLREAIVKRLEEQANRIEQSAMAIHGGDPTQISMGEAREYAAGGSAKETLYDELTEIAQEYADSQLQDLFDHPTHYITLNRCCRRDNPCEDHQALTQRKS